MLFKKAILIVLFFLLACVQAHAGSPSVDLNFLPFTDFTLRVPAYESPFPGLGSNFSSLSKGLDTVMWNPAGLAKIGTAETQIDLSSSAGYTPLTKTRSINDTSFEVGSSNSVGFNNYILYTSDPASTFTASREINAKINYSTITSAISFKQALKIGDNYAIGILTRGDTGASVNLAGTMPIQWLSTLDLTNVSNFMGSGVSTKNGQLTYTHTPPGMSPYTYTSEASVWSGFLLQSQRLPFSAISDSRNDINIQANYTMTGATKWGGLSFGANLTPISAAANINNSIRLIAKEGARNGS